MISTDRTEKKCSKCQIVKPFPSDFYKGRSECKPCHHIYKESAKEKIKLQKKQYYLANKEYILARCADYQKKNEEIVKERKRDYVRRNKSKISEYHKKYRAENKEKVSEKSKRYYQQNKVAIRAKNKRNAIKNRAKYAETQRRWQNQNREKCRGYLETYKNKHAERIVINRRKNRQKRYSSDLDYFLKQKLRCLLYNTLKTKGASKNSKTQEYLGCSFADFKAYFESLFEPGMNWDNYGGKRIIVINGKKTVNRIWELEHIKPIRLFDFRNEDEKFMCLNYKNLRPKWWWENSDKGDIIYGIRASDIPDAIWENESLLKMTDELNNID